MGHGEIEPQRFGSEVEVADGFVAGTEGVRPDQRGDGGEQQDDAADRLGTQRLRDVVPLGQGEAAEQRTAGGGGTGAATRGDLRVGYGSDGMADARADQTSRRPCEDLI